MLPKLQAFVAVASHSGCSGLGAQMQDVVSHNIVMRMEHHI
jgi:hypothetical protein